MTYRAVSTILLKVLSYWIAGTLTESITITVSFAILATIFFYLNERAWERTDWGRKEFQPVAKRDDLDLAPRALFLSGDTLSQSH